MKEWKKPFVKWVILDRLMTDTICASQVGRNSEVQGQGAQRGTTFNSWDNE